MSTSQAPGRAWELFAQPCPAMPGQAANMLSSLYLQLPVSKPGSQWCGTLRGLPAWGLGAGVTRGPDFPSWLSSSPGGGHWLFGKECLQEACVIDTLCFLCPSRLGLASQVMGWSSLNEGQTWPGQAGKMGTVLGLLPDSRFPGDVANLGKVLELSKVLGPTGTTKEVGSSRLLGRSYRGKKNRK